jgi:hypothetical protein
MNDPILRSFDARIDDVGQDDHTIVARINTADIDRYNSVIVTKGIRLDNYRKAPIVMHEHGRDARRGADPVGKCLWIRTNGGPEPTELLAKIRFLTDDFSHQRWEWYRDGIMNGFSIRCLPDMERCGPATRDEIKINPALGRGQYSEWGGGPGVLMYRSGELLESSTTSVPGNANCTTVPGFPERAASVMDLVERGLLWVPDDALEVYRSALLTRTTTESMGGLAGGGATVPPANGEKVKAKDGEECDEDEEECDEDEEECDAKEGKDGEKAKGEERTAPPCESEPEPAAEPTPEPKPAKRGLHIRPDEHGMFEVYDGADFIVRYDDQTLAEKAIVAMRNPRTFADAYAEIARAERADGEEIKKYIKDEMNLRLHGVV